ncbi:hypothetical protein ACQUWM_11190 [Marinobacter sp. DUT-3]|uniref:hypothetical protein n=1 Tax=Marinobacter sp. DUT-3 TaxID=3412036 RepID=UPI003D1657A7
MMKHRTSLFMASALLSAAMLTSSPLAMAGKHGDRDEGHHGKHNKAEMCQQLREGTGKFSPEKRQKRMEERQAKMEERRADMADRLELTEEQRETWDEIHQENMEKRAHKMERWEKKMKERCEEKAENNSDQ